MFESGIVHRENLYQLHSGGISPAAQKGKVGELTDSQAFTAFQSRQGNGNTCDCSVEIWVVQKILLKGRRAGVFSECKPVADRFGNASGIGSDRVAHYQLFIG
jgi:hypothetical protein